MVKKHGNIKCIECRFCKRMKYPRDKPIAQHCDHTFVYKVTHSWTPVYGDETYHEPKSKELLNFSLNSNGKCPLFRPLTLTQRIFGG